MPSSSSSALVPFTALPALPLLRSAQRSFTSAALALSTRAAPPLRHAPQRPPRACAVRRLVAAAPRRGRAARAGRAARGSAAALNRRRAVPPPGRRLALRRAVRPAAPPAQPRAGRRTRSRASRTVMFCPPRRLFARLHSFRPTRVSPHACRSPPPPPVTVEFRIVFHTFPGQARRSGLCCSEHARSAVTALTRLRRSPLQDLWLVGSSPALGDWSVGSAGALSRSESYACLPLTRRPRIAPRLAAPSAAVVE